ncbi:MAG: DUF998 domain-containing protein [Chloroflexales bacterium]|nr:DUF998 domain-containing protein [Chloroflexales bacterium]
MNALPTTDHVVSPAAATQPWTLSRILLTIGAAGPIVFLGVATLAGLLAPGYDMRTQPISELAVGPNGWLQTANFYIFGLAIIAFALGLFRSLPRGSWVGTGLLIIAGLGIIGSGVFPTDLKGAPETDAGGLHNLLFLVLFLALIVSYIFSALSFRKLAGWRAYTWATALMPLVVFGLLFVYVGFGSDVGDPLYAVSGLIQRLLLAVAFGWMSVTGWRLRA